ncbi:MAG TPA: polyprenyl synthetase family protein [Anaerolineales bacterium]|nr:polyprenyl synthetase family protein [Anaerolineales bacterium]
MEPTTATFFDLVRDDLPLVEARMREAPNGVQPRLQAAIDQLLTSGGKRLRPTLALLSGRMLAADHHSLIYLAAAIEMLHTATLVHDDLIDGSLVRRGYPTLNAQWPAGATVLAGDYIFARAAHLASRIGSLPLMEQFARTLMVIVQGEVTQLFREGSDDPRQAYFDRIYAKTASLFEMATQGAARLSPVPPETVEAMRRFGFHLGMAFQIVDDALDFVGNEVRVGKPLGSDLRQGLITLPTLCYIESQEDPGLLASLRSGRLGPAEVSDLVDSIRRSGAVDQALAEARQAIAAGEEMLATVPDNPVRAALFEVARYIVDRTV